MKRFLVPCALALALVVPTEATAKANQYAGPANPSGSVSFTVKVTKRKGKKKKQRVTRFDYSRVPVNCADGLHHTTSGFFEKPSDPVKVRGGEFSFHGRSLSDDTLQIDGTLTGGTLRVAGSLLMDDGGTGSDCDSGVINWSAARV